MERRPLQFANMLQAADDAERLQATGYDRAGNWSLGEVLSHLNKTVNMAFEPVSFGVPGLLKPVLKWFVFGKMQRGDVIKFRATAPKSVQPDDDTDVARELATFRDLCERIEDGKTALLPKHPLFGAFSRDEWLTMQRWHAAHHLSFLIPRPTPDRATAPDAD